MDEKPECPKHYWLLADEGCRCTLNECPECTYDYERQRYVPCKKHEQLPSW